MSDVTDELVDVIAEAAKTTEKFKASDGVWSVRFKTETEIAQAVLAALVERYGEPEIEGKSTGAYEVIGHTGRVPIIQGKNRQRRLVFPWQAVD